MPRIVRACTATSADQQQSHMQTFSCSQRCVQTAVVLMTGVRCQWSDSSWLTSSYHNRYRRWWVDMCLCIWRASGEQLARWGGLVCWWECVCVMFRERSVCVWIFRINTRKKILLVWVCFFYVWLEGRQNISVSVCACCVNLFHIKERCSLHRCVFCVCA